MDRLQKILSRAGVASRRASERLILEGRVTVNGVVVRELGTKADLSHDDVRVDGRRVKAAARYRYLLLNKPRGYVTTRLDPQRRPTVLDLIAGVREYVYPIGRLDFDSEGLLILTNDGDLAARLMHPRHGVARVYEVSVLGVPDTRDLHRLGRGVTVGGRRTAPAGVRLSQRTRPDNRQRSRHVRGNRASHTKEETVMFITIREGRNREVRRMCDAIGHPVSRLKRIAIGPIRDPGLKPGQWRELTTQEVERLRATASSTVKSET